ncbi:hypothetical protein B0H10DRAFT_1943765 [Mycena sp. CBHHK59/15]|nr:hypothetical protein B0H10DRAFT_1943765 [Mycena sp. CBHHK59/15]
MGTLNRRVPMCRGNTVIVWSEIASAEMPSPLSVSDWSPGKQVMTSTITLFGRVRKLRMSHEIVGIVVPKIEESILLGKVELQDANSRQYGGFRVLDQTKERRDSCLPKAHVGEEVESAARQPLLTDQPQNSYLSVTQNDVRMEQIRCDHIVYNLVNELLWKVKKGRKGGDGWEDDQGKCYKLFFCMSQSPRLEWSSVGYGSGVRQQFSMGDS